MPRRVAVVGAGITGLACAWFAERDHGADVTLYEASDHLGGIVRTVELDGTPVDVGPDAFLARQPAFGALVERLGLGHDRVAPRSSQVWLWARGRLRPLPTDTVLGVPSSLPALARSGALSWAGLARAALEPLVPGRRLTVDDTVAAVVAARFGDAVSDTLVAPLLSGVYAGDLDQLGLDAAAAPVAELAADHRSLLVAARRRLRRAPADAGPMFNTLTHGLAQVPSRIATDLGGRVRVSSPVSSVSRDDDVWRLRLDGGGTATADAVVLALPAHAAAAVLAESVPAAAAELGAVAYASVGVVTLAYPEDAAARVPDGSGVLVPPGGKGLVKAATLLSGKWPHHHGGDRIWVRASVGRIDDTRALDLDDAEVAARADAEVRTLCGIGRPAELRHVTRWPRGLPQYTVGHRARVERVRSALAAAGPGLHAGGAAFDGVGISACVAQAERLATAATDTNHR